MTKIIVDGDGAEWHRTAFVLDSGEVFMPSPNEMEALLCAGYDGTPVIQHANHCYFPVGFLKELFPHCVDILESTEGKIKDAANEAPPAHAQGTEGTL